MFEEVLTEVVTIVSMFLLIEISIYVQYMCINMNIVSMDVLIFLYMIVYIFYSRPNTLIYSMIVLFIVVES